MQLNDIFLRFRRLDLVEPPGQTGSVAVRGIHQRGDQGGIGTVRVNSQRGRVVLVEEQNESFQGEALRAEGDELLVTDVHVRAGEMKFFMVDLPLAMNHTLNTRGQPFL